LVLALSSIVACAASPQAAVTPRAAATGSAAAPQDERSAKVEHGLLPPVRVRGEDVRYELEERMRHYRIPAVSIAVFENYELAWAKAYGFAALENSRSSSAPNAPTRSSCRTRFLPRWG